MVERIQKIVEVESVVEKRVRKKEDFKELLQDKIKLSKHAEERLNSNRVILGGREAEKLFNAVKKAEEKGAHCALILTDETAYIVDVREKKIVTIISRGRMRENVFTNIDTVVLA